MCTMPPAPHSNTPKMIVAGQNEVHGQLKLDRAIPSDNPDILEHAAFILGHPIFAGL